MNIEILSSLTLEEKSIKIFIILIVGNTALHDCAESGSLEIMKLLLEQSANMEKDSYGMTPLLSAAVTGRTEIIDHLISLESCKRADKIDALELLGATYIDKKRDFVGALTLWKGAMAERYRPGCDVIEKECNKRTVEAYEHAVEAGTVTELQCIISDPDQMRMQALLTRERILGASHPDTTYYIRYRGAVYADMGKFNRCIALWTYALQIQQKMLEPLSPMTQSSLLTFAELFSYMLSSSNIDSPERYVCYDDMMKIYLIAIKELRTSTETAKQSPSVDKDRKHFHRLLLNIMHLLALLCKIQNQIPYDQQRELLLETYKLVKLNPKGFNDHSLLHLACDRNTSTVGRYPICEFPSIEVVALLLEVGAAINMPDCDQNTPLHIAAMNKPCDKELILMLVENNAHLDACNNKNKTAPELLKGETIQDILQPLNYISLQCLAARKINKDSLKYKGLVSKEVEAFIEFH